MRNRLSRGDMVGVAHFKYMEHRAEKVEYLDGGFAGKRAKGMPWSGGLFMVGLRRSAWRPAAARFLDAAPAIRWAQRHRKDVAALAIEMMDAAT